MINFILAADLHIRSSRPKNRIDNFKATQYKKIEWLLDLCVKYKARLIISGDIFETAFTSYRVINKYIKLFRRYRVKIYVIYGQHDLRYHSPKSYENTPLANLEAGRVVELVGERPGLEITSKLNINIYGAGWGHPIPEIKKPDQFNILLIHKLIVHKKALWKGQENFTTGRSLLKKNDYDLIVSGDNHQSFVYELLRENKTLVNPGSLMRTTSAQLDHKPTVYLFSLYNKDKYGITPIEVPIAPASEVFDLDKIEEGKERLAKLQDFTESLKEQKAQKLDFKKNMIDAMEITRLSRGVRSVLDEIMEEATE